MSFKFDPVDHVYTLNGNVLPSVTGIIKPLFDFSMIKPEVLEYKRALGTAVHLATELYDADDLDEDSLDEAVIPYLNAWKKFKVEMKVEIITSEQPIYHVCRGYAGMLDRTATVNKRPFIIDIKCTAALSPATGIQLAGYKDMIGQPHNRRAAVQLKPNGNYVFEEYDDDSDLSTFLSLLNVQNWIKKHDK